jgi:hypothetical protein
VAHGIVGLAGIVARDHLDAAAEQSAAGIDLLDRQLPRLAIGHQKLRDRRVAVDLADSDRPRRLRAGRCRQRGTGRGSGEQAAAGV